MNRRVAAFSAGLPVAAWLAALFVGVEPGQWLSAPAGLMRSIAPDALLYTAACTIIAAPIAGVAIWSSARLRSQRTPAGTTVDAITGVVAVVAILVAASACLTLVSAGGNVDALRFVATSHATLAAVALALSALGALCGAAFRDPLDAAACSLSIALAASGGLLVAGASVADMPKGIVDVALLGSPLVAMASAAHIDLVRMDTLYQISTLAHLGVDYPAWPVTAVCYLAAAVIGLAGLAWISGAGGHVPLRRPSAHSPN